MLPLLDKPCLLKKAMHILVSAFEICLEAQSSIFSLNAVYVMG